MFFRFTIAIPVALVLTGASSAAPQSAPSDPILAGYTRFYAGDADDAYRHFEALRARDARSIPAWFGQLFAHQSRIDVDETLAPSFERDIARFIDHADERHRRSRTDTEALFYLAQAYMLRSTYRVTHDKGLWGAARDGAKAKGYAEPYIKQYPAHGDAYLTLGLYNYAVDIAPNFVKVLRVLLLLPAGNRAEGLKQLERAAREGSLFAPLAETVLVNIYGPLEGRLAEAITIAERSVHRFSGNASMRQDLAQLYAHPAVERYDRAADQYDTVIAAATTSSLRHLSERHRATAGLANLRRTEWRIDEAISLLTPTIDRRVEKPVWVMPTFLLHRGNYRFLLNDRTAAEDPRRVLSDPGMAKWHKAAQEQLGAFEVLRTTDENAIYAALIPGNRLVVEDRWDEAKAVYDRVGASRPNDWQVRYRRAYLEFARGDYAAAAAGFDALVSTNARIPAWLKAAAMLNLAWTHDIAGRRVQALKLYKRIVDDYEDESSSGLARLGLVAPYRGPIKIS